MNYRTASEREEKAQARKWCARIVGEIEYFDEYEQRVKHDN